MGRDSFVFYRSFYDSIKELDLNIQSEIYNAIFQYQFDNEEVKLNGIPKAIFSLIKPQLDANNSKYENGCKGGRPKTKTKPNQKQSKTEAKRNVNENENVNDNDNVAVKGSDSCADGLKQFDSCVDGVVKFYEENIGTLSPYEFELLDSYRENFNDDVIIYALQLQTEAKAKSINYAKAILNNWKKKNIKTLLDAKNENMQKQKNEKNAIDNKFCPSNDSQYANLDRFYSN